MDPSDTLATAIDRLGLTPIARKMGIPISTLDGWKKNGRIPGRGAAKQWREALFWGAVKELDGGAPSDPAPERCGEAA
ncbi:MAG: hypothetical protein FD144_4790 [Rhodospirillaceae bacterium]|nr:MAG: hypothetical protein FD144_4790 [Rhodospirillaceae bacterium]